MTSHSNFPKNVPRSVHSMADTRSSFSLEPAPTETEGRISISSTVYPGSSADHSYDSHFSYHLPSNTNRSRRPSSVSPTSPDRESFMELSPASTPRSSEFPRNDGPTLQRVTSAYSTFSVNPNLYKQKSKEKDLPALYIPSPTSKPPVPTAPKPDFRRSHSAHPSSNRSSSADTLRGYSPPHAKPSQTLPPTTSLLNPRERAERIRQNKKLTQVFGQPPGNVEAIAFSHSAYQANAASSPHLTVAPTSTQASASAGKRKAQHQRGAVSMSVADDPATDQRESRAIWPPPEGTVYLSLSDGRRHSSPLTTMEFVVPDIDSATWSSASRSSSPVRDASDLIDVGPEEGVPRSDWSSHIGHRKTGGPGSSPTSFMDLSDEEGPADALSIITVETPTATTRRTAAPFSSSIPSLPESLSAQAQAEEDRRRKRDKIAKLHRFLGSRVPVDLVLAQVDERSVTPSPVTPMPQDLEARKARIRRRRSSSAAELGGTWSDDIDRLKEDLNEREKAINVRRAVKMEKVCLIHL